MNSIVRFISALFIILLPLSSSAKVKVVASINDLVYFTKQIGGDLVDVTAIAPPKADVHYVEVRPSYMMKVARADVVLKVGLELDMWMDRIIDGSRNNRLEIVDCSHYIKPLEVPTFKADARYGDLHRFGNPHYWIGPQNVKAITDAIVEGLANADPEHADIYRTNQQQYLAGFEKGLKRLDEKVAKLKGKEIIYYHDSWPYFDEYTGLVAVDFIEPYPGVAPSPSHVKDLVDLIKRRHIKVIAVEPYFDKRVPEKIASETGAHVVTLYPSVGGHSKHETYLEWLEKNLDELLEAYR